MGEQKIDKPFLFITLILILSGFFIFTSASLGLLAKDGANFSSVAFNQILFGLIFGSVTLILISKKINYKLWNKYAFYIFLISLILTALVFIPGLGFLHGGAKRWIMIGPISFQPAEFLKLGFVAYLATWFAMVKTKISLAKHGIIPLAIIIAIPGILLIIQPDIGTLLVLISTGIGMFIVAGGKWAHTISFCIILLIGFVILISFKPYIKDRLETFMRPSDDPQNSGYQIRQSLIAVGSGQLFGRGFGQSIQKFDALPEPIGDSIFAVFAEEWGFVGCVALLILFLAFTFRGFRIASKAPTNFGRLLVVGIILLIVTQSVLNMASMIGVAPLMGMPLIFVSKGGTALFFALASVGIILNVSKYKKA